MSGFGGHLGDRVQALTSSVLRGRRWPLGSYTVTQARPLGAGPEEIARGGRFVRV